MKKPKYKIGQKVQGINGVNAKISGIMTGKFYSKITFELPNRVCPYDKLDPNWRDKYVYYLEFDTPTQYCTLKEFIEAYNGQYEEDMLVKEYKTMRKVYSLSVPEFNVKSI